MRHYSIMRFLCAAFLGLLFMMPSYVVAQEDMVLDLAGDNVPLVDDVVEDKVEEKQYKRDYKTNLLAEKIPSLFFTYWHHQAILEAKNSNGVMNIPSDWDLNNTNQIEPDVIEPGLRYVSVGGIVYKGENDWTIWINGERITPRKIPKEIIDLKVFDDVVEVKWLDAYTAQIFPIRLRAHERFNLDTRMFLPGAR